MNTPSTAHLATALVLASLPLAHTAQVDVARNSVKTSSSQVKAGGSVAPGSSIATGSKAKTQISLGANGSLMRAGSKTEAVLQNDSELALRQGVMLASSGKRGMGREPVSVETPETKATVKGTMLVAYQPKSYIKVTCIEGQVTVKLKALVGEFVTLQEGQMVIINPAEKQLPQEVEVDLDELTRTSALLGPDFPRLGATARLARAVDRQAMDLNQGEALRTPLILLGAGLDVTLSNDRRGAARQRAVLEATKSAPKTKLQRLLASVRRRSPGPSGPGYVIDGTTQFSSSPTAPTLQTPGFPLKEGIVDSGKPTTWRFSNSRIPDLLINRNVNLPTTSASGDTYLANGTLLVGDLGTTQVGVNGPLNLGAQDVGVTSSQLIGTSNSSSGVTLAGLRSVDIVDSRIDQASHIKAVGPTIRVNRSNLTAGFNGIQITANGPGEGISITNSSQLSSLSTAVGIVLQTDGSPITIRNSQIDGRNVVIDTMLPSSVTPDGMVEIRNSVINGDTIRARAFRSGGDRNALVIDGSTFNAVNAIKFYAEGASRLVFRGNVRVNLSDLSAGEAVFAGRTVQADNGATVNVNGNLRVFRDTDNYNKPGFGNIEASGSQSHRPFDERPNF